MVEVGVRTNLFSYIKKLDYSVGTNNSAIKTCKKILKTAFLLLFTY